MCPEKECSYPLNRRLWGPHSNSGLDVSDTTKISFTACSRTPHRPTRSRHLLSFSSAPLLDLLLSHSFPSYFFVFSLFLAIPCCLFFFKCLGKLLKVYGYSSSDHESDVPVPFICYTSAEVFLLTLKKKARQHILKTIILIFTFYLFNYMFNHQW